MTEKDIQKIKDKDCNKCGYYYKGSGVTKGCCNYLELEGKRRPCRPGTCREHEVFKPKTRGRKKLDSVRICFLLTGIGIALFGIRNYILKYKIYEEDGQYNSKSQMIVGLSLLTLWFALGL